MPRRSAGSLLLSLKLDRSPGELLSEQIYLQIREFALSGHLAAGARLPATRVLAKEHGIARSTVAEAYDRLAAEGVITSRTGSGSFVSSFLGQDLTGLPGRGARAGALVAGSRRLQLSRAVESAIPQLAARIEHPRRCFTTATPDFDLFPIEKWSKVIGRTIAEGLSDQLGYPDARGLPAFRRAIASHLKINRAISCDAGQVFVFAGAQQAIHFIHSIVLEPGDTVWLEDPGAIGVRNSLITCGANVVPVPIDDEGLIVAEGLKLARRFRLAFVTPTHQHPLGVPMSLERRLQLLSTAQHADAIILEDDYDGDFYYGRHPVQALQSIDRSGRVIYIGSFSKSLFPSLRLGYAVVPAQLVDVFDKAVSAFLHGSPVQTQAAVAAFIESGQFAVHLRSMRRAYHARSEALADAADRHLKGMMQVKRTDAGLHTTGQLLIEADEAAVSAAAAEHGITLTPLSKFCIGPVKHRGFMLGFAVANEQEIRKAVRKLAPVIESVARRRARAVQGSIRQLSRPHE